jgi:hypothetical protein
MLLDLTGFEPLVLAIIKKMIITTISTRGIEYSGIGMVKKLIIGRIRQFQKSTFPDISTKE